MESHTNPNYITDTHKFERTTIKIPSATPGCNLDAWKYVPKGAQGLFPVVILWAHGFSANKLQGLAAYCVQFASKGYGCVAFDYRHWGDSDGDPRWIISVKNQQEDYRTVVKWSRQQSEFDPQRVILWGTSFSGSHVVQLATEKAFNIIATIIQCPYLGVGQPPSFSWTTIKMLLYAMLDWTSQVVGMHPWYIRAVAQPGHVGILNWPGCVEGMTGLCFDKRDYANKVSASSLFELMSYKIMPRASRVTCPFLICAAEHDNLCFIQGAIEFTRRCPTAELITLDCDHWSIYPGQSHDAEVLETQLAFLRKEAPV